MVRRGDKLQVGEGRAKELIKAGLAQEVEADETAKDTTAPKPKAKVVSSRPKPGEDRETKTDEPTETK